LLLFLTLTIFTAPVSAQILGEPLDSDGDGVPNSQEAHDGTNSLSVDSFIEHVGSTYCANWNGYLFSQLQVLELRNAGCSTADIQITLRNSDGIVQHTSPLSLLPGRQFDVVANVLSGFQPMSYGTLCATIQSGDPDTLDARMTTYDLSGETFRSAFSVAAAPARSGPQFVSYNNYFPTLNAAELSNQVQGWVQVSNDESTAQAGELVYYSEAGTELKRVAITIAAGGRFDSDTHTVGANTVGAVEWHPTDTNKKFRMVLNRYYFNSAGTNYAGIVAIPARRPSGRVLASSFQTNSRLSVLELTNTLSIGVTVSVSVFDAAGSLTSTQPGAIALPAKGTAHVILNNYLPSGTGKVQFSADLPQSIISALLEYALDSSNRFVFANFNEPKAGFGVTQRSSYNNFLGGCRLRLTNLTNATRSAQVDVTRADGTTRSFTSPVQVPADGVADFDLCASDVQGNYGGVVVTPSTAETVLAEVFRDNSDTTANFRTAAVERSICSAGLRLDTASLSLIASSGTPGTVIVTNTSPGIIASGITAVLPSGWNDVTVDSTSCATLNPGASCTISFTPGTTVHSAASVSIVGSNTSEVLPTVVVDPNPMAVITLSGSPLPLETNGPADTLTLTNTSATTSATNITSSFTATALDGNVVETGNTCANVAPLSSCTLTFTPGSTVVSQTSFSIQGTNTNTLTAAISIAAPPMTTLSASVSDLALSMTGFTEYGIGGTPSSGLARTITITNTGLIPATGVNISFPTWPSGTTASSTCGATLAAASSCVITITPGNTATSDGTDPTTVSGTAPIPGVVAVSASNAATVNTNVVVIGYGTIWQGGHVFALDDTTANTGSVGGKVMTTSDQSAGIVWSSNGSGSSVLDSIYGVSEGSTTSSPNPSAGQVAGQVSCNGATDGACNTNNIYVYYQTAATGAPINSSFYAVGLCKQTISGFSDWYLPAVCEMGYDTSSEGSGCGVAGTPTVQNMQSDLIDFNSLNLVSGAYWSSTEYSGVPNSTAWYQVFSVGGSQSVAGKGNMLRVRCARGF
jgi:hypothetical protein